MNELEKWLVKHFVKIGGSTDNTDSRDQSSRASNLDKFRVEIISEIANDENTPLKDLKTLLINLIKDQLKINQNINVSHNIFDQLIKFLLGNLGLILSQDSLTLKEVTDIYISVLYEIENTDDINISKFDPYQQFSPDTIKFLNNSVAKDNNILDFINVDYWEKEIFGKISEVKGNSELLFSIRSLIAFLNLIKNKNKRIKENRS